MEIKYNKIIEAISKKIPCVGFSVALFDNEKILYKHHKGYINKNKEYKTDDDSMFMIGSNTKVLTSICLFQLLEQGKLSLDDDIKKYIPELNIKSKFDYDKITIRQLLMHRGGIQCDLYNLCLDNDREYHEIIKELEKTYLTRKPGTMFAYSNNGYTLLGIIIERISGLSYVDYVEENIAKVLGLDIKFVVKDTVLSENMSLCYSKKQEETIDYVSTLLPEGTNTYMKISGLVKIGQMFLNEGIIDNKVFLKKETIDLMKELKVETDLDLELYNGGHGLLHNSTYYSKDIKVYGHGGNTFTHHSHFSFIPQYNVGIVVFTNTENAIPIPGSVAVSIMKEYLKSKGAKLDKLPPKYTYVKFDNKEKYEGLYVSNLGLHDFKFDSKNNLTSTIQGLKVKFKLCEDGYMHASPNDSFIKNILFKKQIKTLRFKFANYYDEDVMVLEQIKGGQKANVIFGTKYVENTITDSLWSKALGEYEVINVKYENTKMLLLNENNRLKIALDLINEKVFKYLKIEDDNLSFSQGFGRDTKEAIHLEEKDGYYYLTCSGIVGRKKID